jgi:hypothetical protein
MKPIDRQTLTALLKKFAINAIDNADQPGMQAWGRQLATICEQVAASLRIKFGGRSALLVSHAPSAKKTAQNPNGETHEQRVMRAFRLAYGYPEPTAEWLAPQLGLDADSKIVATVIARVQQTRHENPIGRRFASTHDAVILDNGKRVEIPIWPVDNLTTGGHT